MKHKWRTTAIVAAIVLAILALLAVNFHLQNVSAVEDYEKQLRAAGEKLTIEEVRPQRVSFEHNSAETYRQVAAKLKGKNPFVDDNPPGSMRLVAPGKAMIGWDQPDIRNHEHTNSWDELAAAVASHRADLNLLHEIIEKPVLDFDLPYERGPDTLLPHLAPLKSVVRELSAAVAFDLHTGDRVMAVKDLRAMLALAKGMRDEKLVISQLVRIAMASITSAATWELLQSPKLTDEQLASLQQDWSELEFIGAYEQAMQMERAMLGPTVRKLKREGLGTAFGTGSSGDEIEDLKSKAKEVVWRVWWSDRDQLLGLKGYQAILESTRLLKTNYDFHTARNIQSNRLAALHLSEAHEDSLGWLEPNYSITSTLLSSSVSALAGGLGRVMRIEIEKQQTITAIALERYRLKHREYPPELSALVPDILAAVPLDPVDGKPMRYQRRNDGGFLLYSIGENAKDDGGDPNPPPGITSLNRVRGLDFLWPSPATEAEVQAFQTNRSR